MDPAGQARVERRLAAILADVASYSWLIGAMRATPYRALRRELLDPKIAEHGRNRMLDRGCEGRGPPRFRRPQVPTQHKRLVVAALMSQTRCRDDAAEQVL
jgi:hypothetical protein